MIRLPDGRWLVARVPHDHWHAGFGLFFLLALIALGVGVGAYPVVRRLTARLERLQAGVKSLGAGDLAARVKVEGHDEVARLAESFNQAAARIEELVGAHKSLLANASHELRTPLARIRMAVELIKENADPKRKRDLALDIAELDALIDEILLASRLESVTGLDLDEEIDLLALASEECARYEAVELEGQPVTVRGDPRLLRRMIRNLLENARPRCAADRSERSPRRRRSGIACLRPWTGYCRGGARARLSAVSPICRCQRERRGWIGAGPGAPDRASTRRRCPIPGARA